MTPFCSEWTRQAPGGTKTTSNERHHDKETEIRDINQKNYEAFQAKIQGTKIEYDELKMS